MTGIHFEGSVRGIFVLLEFFNCTYQRFDDWFACILKFRRLKV
jgi:hypothetical protein